MKKPLIKTLVATFVAVTTMAIASTVAFAATNVYEYECGTGTNTDNFFTVSSAKLTSDLASSDDATVSIGGESKTVNVTSALKMNNDGSVKFTTNGISTVYVVWAARSNKDSTCSMNFDGSKYSETSTSNKAAKTTELVVSCSENVAAGSHTITRASGESGLYYVKVIDVVDDSAKEYTVTGDLSGDSALLAGKTIKIGDFEATVNSDGSKYTISKTVSADPFTSASNLTASYSDEFDVAYADGATGVTFTAGSGTAYTGTAITFTRKALGTLEDNKTYTSYTRPNFDLKDKDGNAILNGGVDKASHPVGSTLSFKLSGPATITATVKNGSGTDGNTASLSFSNESSTVLAKSGSIEASATSYFTCYAPSAGTYTITLDEDSKTACHFNQIIIGYTENINIGGEEDPTLTNTYHNTSVGFITSDGTDYYLAIYVPKSKVESLSEVKLGDVTSNTVYESITIGDKTLYPANKDDNYLFAVKVPANLVSATDAALNIVFISNNFNYADDSNYNDDGSYKY